MEFSLLSDNHPQLSATTGEPPERLIADALGRAGIAYRMEGSDPAATTFQLPSGIELTVTRSHDPAAAERIAGAPNAILVQGEAAARTLAELIAPQRARPETYHVDLPPHPGASLPEGLARTLDMLAGGNREGPP